MRKGIDTAICLKEATLCLKEAGIESPAREARILLAHQLDQSADTLFFNPPQVIKSVAKTLFDKTIDRRCQGEPLSKILGRREFWGRQFRVTQDTLDPRPDSECLIEAVHRYFPDFTKPYQILDLGTGTGCLLTTLLCSYSGATGIAIDISEKALTVAKDNLGQYVASDRYHLICSSWVDALVGSFDIVVANPPYLAEDWVADKALSYDPPQALYAGTNGLAAYQALLPVCKRLARSTTTFFFEIGFDQEISVQALLQNHGIVDFEFIYDYGKRARVAVFAYTV